MANEFDLDWDKRGASKRRTETVRPRREGVGFALNLSAGAVSEALPEAIESLLARIDELTCSRD